VDKLGLLKNIKVLYVEDEPITRLHVSKMLKCKLGKVILAKNGEEGIQNFIQFKPDIIITDLVMPDMSGLDMMKKIRSMGYKCPAIITSALSDSKTIIESVDLKIEKYIIKPIDENKLMQKLIELAVEERDNNRHMFTFNVDFDLSNEERQQLQLGIRNIYSRYLKKITGKGAKTIQVFIKGNQIEILAKDNLTILEESLLRAGKYNNGIDLLRRAIYENTMKDIEKEIGHLVNRSITLKKIELFPEERYERIMLNID
jgi:YesN/AraC family two-component response regulator